MTYNSIVLADSPKNYVTFDQSGTLTDSGSQNNTLVTTNAGTKTAPGIGGSGNYMTFNGTSNTIGITNGYDFAAGTAWSIEAWFLTSDTTATKEIIRRDGNGRAYLLRIAGQNIEWYCNISGSEILTSGTNYADGKWHHVVGTYSSGTMKLYIDGTQYGTTGTGNAGTQTATATTYIGSSGGTSEFFNGNLDEVAIYNVALTSTQVTTHYNAGIVNVTTTPPAMNFGTNALSMATPRVGPADVTVSAPAATLSLATATPVVTAGTGFTATPPAATMSLSSPSAKALVSVTVAATGDSSGGFTQFTVNTGTATSGSGSYINFATPTVPTGKVLDSATLEFQFSSPTGYTIHFGQMTSTSSPYSMINHHDYVVTTTPTSFTYYSVDVTNIIQAWIGGAANDGIGISKESTGGGSGTVTFESVNASGQNPKIVYSYTDAAPPVIVTPPAMTLSLDAVTPSVSTTSGVNAQPPAMTLSLSFPGGAPALPDYTANAPVMTMSMTAPVPLVDIEYPVTVTPPPMTLSLDTPSGVTIDLTTNVLKIPPPMTMSMLMVGLFDAAHDRYFAKVTGTVDADDIWYKLDETSGTRALDSIYGDSVSSTNWTQSGYYWGTPTFGTIGEQLRKAVTFNGSTDYLTVGPYAIDNKYATVGLANDVNPLMAATIEFSIRTTQTDGGVVFAATGAQSQSVAAANPSSSVTALPVLNGCKVTIEAGQLVIHDSGKSTKVRKFIADGQWHHVIMAIPDEHNINSDFMGGSTPHYVQIDGQTILARYGGFVDFGHETGDAWLPYSFMAESQPFADLGTGAPILSTNTINYLAGDLSNVIVRLNSYVAPTLAESIYYEWSAANVVNPTPMTLSLTAVDPFKAKGSVKKILALYGLPWGHDDQNFPLRTYMSTLSGMVIANMANNSLSPVSVQGVGGSIPSYPEVTSFMLNGYLVVPVSIMGDSTISGPSSLDGTLNPDSPTMYGRFVDDSTGLWRFINLQTDLSQNVVDEYEIITVVNYPWERAQGTAGYDMKIGEQFATPQPVHGLSMGFATDSEWQQARDAFRDSLLQAAYDGANLWIGEYEMAYHLGFIQGYDMHDAGHWGVGNLADNNKRAWDLDYANINPQLALVPTYPYTGVPPGGQQRGYLAYPQANWYRRIVTLVPGLTDIPGDELGDYIEGWDADDFLPNGNYIAYNIVRRPNGLQLGDKVFMRALYKGSKFTGDLSGSYSNFRVADHLPVISAHPDGIAGTVVAREQDSFYGPDGVVVDNPYKNNAITIAAEVGTVVRGRPIAGRAFIELMDTNTGYYGIAEDADKTLWHGSPVTDKVTGAPIQVSSWDFDTRRAQEIKVQIFQTVFKGSPNNDPKIDGEHSGTWFQSKIIWTYIQYFPVAAIGNTAISMHGRGLYWLGQAPQANSGDTRVFATAMTLSLNTPAPSLSSVSSPATQVIGPMRVGLSFVYPANYADGNTEVDLFGAMDMSLDMRGLGSVTSVPPMSLTLTMPNPQLNVAADLVTVYLDVDRNITVFLKEDN